MTKIDICSKKRFRCLKAVHRVHTSPILHHFKMQMETCTVTSVADIAYNLSCRYRFSCGNGSLCHMGVPRGQARTVVKQDLVAIAGVPAGYDDHAAVGGEDRRTLRRGNIRTAMAGVAESIVIAKIAGNVSVTGQRPKQLAVLDDADTAAAKGEQRGAHFIGKKFV